MPNIDKRRIFVFAATGDQGFSACKYLTEAGYSVLGLTRNPEADKSKQLVELGVELVKGDLGHPDSYKHHLEGVYGAYINVDFWVPYFSNGLDPKAAGKTEETHGRYAVDACLAAGLKHVVFSTLEDLGGEQSCEHYNSKARISDYIKSVGLPTTHLYTSTYFSNCYKFHQLKPHPDADRAARGDFLWATPVPDKTVLPAWAPQQAGLWVKAALADPEKWINKDMQACSDILTVAEMAQILSEVSGKTVDTLHMADEAFYDEGLKKEITEELWIQYKIFIDGTMHRDVAASKEIVPEQWDCRTWAQNSPELKKVLGF